jgi:hypothetical protein
MMDDYEVYMNDKKCTDLIFGVIAAIMIASICAVILILGFMNKWGTPKNKYGYIMLPTGGVIEGQVEMYNKTSNGKVQIKINGKLYETTLDNVVITDLDLVEE